MPGLWFHSQSGCIGEATYQCFSLTSMFLFLFLPLSLPPSLPPSKEGRKEGRKDGRKEGRKEGRHTLITKMPVCPGSPACPVQTFELVVFALEQVDFYIVGCNPLVGIENNWHSKSKEERKDGGRGGREGGEVAKEQGRKGGSKK